VTVCVCVCVCARAVSLCCCQCFIVFVYFCRIFCAMQDESLSTAANLVFHKHLNTHSGENILHNLQPWYQVAGQNEQEALQHLGCAS
jgi:hypothetical protein